MSPILLISILLIVGVALILLDLFVPSGGALSVFGSLSILGAIGVTFTINKWLGLGSLAAGILMMPFALKLGLEFWQRTPIGKRVTLTATTLPIEHEPIRIGDVGRAVSELKPMGEIEIGLITVQAKSGGAVIRPGTSVQVVEWQDGVATVRAVT
ncbi:MAG TPA: hypothetical protein PK402_04315 [Tepidisphaeraceae bacterium]|nr:hypothetical protein [Tepidisphaeraceae bacterium]